MTFIWIQARNNYEITYATFSFIIDIAVPYPLIDFVLFFWKCSGLYLYQYLGTGKFIAINVDIAQVDELATANASWLYGP